MTALVVLDSEVLLPDGRYLYNVHPPHRCAGRPCSIHAPSAHRMRDWPIDWSSSAGVFLRRCAHGYYHIDPDDMVFLVVSGQPFRAEHACDGCCWPR